MSPLRLPIPPLRRGKYNLATCITLLQAGHCTGNLRCVGAIQNKKRMFPKHRYRLALVNAAAEAAQGSTICGIILLFTYLRRPLAMNTLVPLIHPSAVIDPSAVLADDVRVGAYTVIGADVQIGAGSVIGAHCSILGPTRMGCNNRVIGHAALGGDPQDKKYQGERTELVIGDNNVFREFVTINRGTAGGGGVTTIGDDNWVLNYTHIAHDCHIGSHCIFSNNTTFAGHVTIGDWVITSGFSGCHQFCRMGSHVFLGMGALVHGDVPPFLMIGIDSHGRPRGINNEGLRRRGFSAERIQAIKRAYRTVYMSGLPLAQACEQLSQQAQDSDDVQQMLDFIQHIDRPLLR